MFQVAQMAGTQVVGTVIGGFGVIAIGTMSQAGRRQRLHPYDYRAARKGIDTAVRLSIPIVTIIDTPGADPSSESEAGAVAREISQTFEALLNAPVPTVACVTGEGGSGGALALAACDRLMIMEGAFFAVIAPEGAASILKREDVENVARDLRLTAHDLRAFGLADRVLPDPGSDQPDYESLREDFQRAVAWALDDIARAGGAPTARRLERWRVWRPA
jgi:acetyl-CoA carboxylase alpha subunit